VNRYNFQELPERLAQNSYNWIQYFNDDGQLVKLRFTELSNLVVNRAAYLRGEVGNASNVSVVLYAKPGIEWVVAALGAIYCGYELIALPETMTNEEVVASTETIEFGVVIANDDGLLLPSFQKKVLVSVNDFIPGVTVHEAKHGNNHVNDNVSERPTTNDIEISTSVVAFTSGSTAGSKLKAFKVDYGNSLAFSDRFRKVFDITRDDNWTVVHSFSHIVHFEYVLGGLYWGYNVTVTSVIQLFIKGQEINPAVLVTVPTVYEQIVQLIQNKFSEIDDGAKVQEEIESREVSRTDGRIVRHKQCEAASLLLGQSLKMMLIGASPSSLELQTKLLQYGLPMYEGYGMSELNMISCNTPDVSFLGSVGPVWPGMHVKIENDIIHAKDTLPRTSCYINASTEDNVATFLHGGWICTGDIGVLNNKLLTITGREKEVIVNAGGENINPAPIEKKILALVGVEHVVLYGDRKPYLVAIISTSNALSTVDKIKRGIEGINKNLPIFQRVLDTVFVSPSFSVSDGTLTRSGKVRKGKVVEHYNKEIENIYSIGENV